MQVLRGLGRQVREHLVEEVCSRGACQLADLVLAPVGELAFDRLEAAVHVPDHQQRLGLVGAGLVAQLGQTAEVGREELERQLARTRDRLHVLAPQPAQSTLDRRERVLLQAVVAGGLESTGQLGSRDALLEVATPAGTAFALAARDFILARRSQSARCANAAPQFGSGERHFPQRYGSRPTCAARMDPKSSEKKGFCPINP